MVDFLHHPDASGDGDLVADRRRLDDRSQFFRSGADRVLDILLKNGVEFIAVHDPLAGDADDQTAVFGAVDVIGLQQMPQKYFIILLRDPVKAGEREHPRSQFRRRHLAAGGERAHGLVIKQAVGQPFRARRFDKPFLDIQLHQRDALYQIPRDHVGQHGARFGMFLAHDEPHFRRVAASAGSAHALQKAGHRKRRVDLERAFQPADVDSQFQGRRRADRKQRVVVLHFFLGAFAVGRGEVAVMDQKAVGLVLCFAVLPQMLTHRLAFLARIGKDQALAPSCVFKDITHARIGGGRRVIGRWLQRRDLGDLISAFVRLRIGVEEMLHREPPDLFAAFKLRNHRRAVASGSQKFSGSLRIADRRGQADPPRLTSGKAAHPLDQTEGLHTPVAAQQRVDLVDHDKPQIVKQRRDLHIFVDHQRFERFRRDL